MRVEVWSDTKPDDDRNWQQYFGGEWYLTVKNYNDYDKDLAEATNEAEAIAAEVGGRVLVW